MLNWHRAPPPDWGDDEEEALDPEWEAEYPKRPAPISALPKLRSLPLERTANGECLLELVSDYVQRKCMALADLMERLLGTQQGIESADIWTKMEAIKTMSATVGVPNMKWDEL